MTTNEATAIVAQLELVPKRAHYAAHNPRVDEKGRGLVDITTTASTVTIQRWFKDVGACITRLEAVGLHSNGNGYWQAWFDWM